MRLLIFSILTLFRLLLCQGQVDHWESVVLERDDYTYLLPTSQPDGTWNTLDYDDSEWNNGISGFGYGDDDDQTQLTNPSISVYLRKVFEVVDIEAIDQALFHMDYDDGFVAYFNGIEIARDQISGNPPAFNQTAEGLHEALLYRNLTPPSFSLDVDLLRTGENILAVEVHNESNTSSDFTAIPFLSFGINNQSNDYRNTPDWFQAPGEGVDFESSNLPIILIETINSQEILDEPKINADMTIVYRGANERTLINDDINVDYVDYRGKIQIEFRGSSSQSLPKKPFGFTTYDNAYLNKDNVSLLGFPEENDWILNALAFDPSYLRDYLTYNLARDLVEYATRTRYCEVVLNGDYIGLYVLQEKIKPDNNRVDINEINADDNLLPDLSGGYVVKADKPTGGDPIAWEMPNSSGWGVNFIHHAPTPDEITSSQTNYIRSVFQDLAAQANNASLTSGYPSLIDIPSFIDFMLLNELASNPDAYQFSTYFHKDRNGKLRAGPIWDINLSYGNDLFDFGYDRSHTDIWQFENENSGATFWKGLFYNTTFRCNLSKRWNELTQPGQPFHLATLQGRIDAIVLEIDEAGERDRTRWGLDENFELEISNMKNWIASRIQWMNANIGSISNSSDVTIPDLVISKIHYHPAENDLGENDQEFIEILNNGSTSVSLRGYYFRGTGLVYQFPTSATIDPSQSIVLANDTDTYLQVHGKLPFGEYSRALSNSGQTLKLSDAFGNIIDEVSYSDDAPWPAEADGDGLYLQLIDPNQDNNDPTNWMAKELTIQGLLTIQKTENTISVYPNPFTNLLNIQSKQSISMVYLRSLSGILISSQKGKGTSLNVTLTDLTPGIYILEVKSADGKSSQTQVLKK